MLIDTYDDILQNDTIGKEDKISTNTLRHQMVNENFKYDFQDIIDSIGEDLWTDYISSLKKK